jgi:Cupin-like domain
MKLEIINDIDQDTFIEQYVARNEPVVVRGIPFEREQFTPTALKARIGDLTTQVYGSLFDLENITSLADYIDTWFGRQDTGEKSAPYVRWYNQLKNVDFAWGDEAFARLADAWHKPNCIPDRDLVVPPAVRDRLPDPVTDPFPYRAIQVAARGARTRLHRDPFCSDAVVSQFYGMKEAALYHPSRAAELLQANVKDSFGGFIDVRGADLAKLSVEPDYQGQIAAGDMIFIPHGWLHDVLVVEDSISVTWNFIHSRGAEAFRQYLCEEPEKDSEFEILQYFLSRGGRPFGSPGDILATLN